MPSFDWKALLPLLQSHRPADILHAVLEALGGLTALWLIASQLIPKLTLWLLPWATRAGAALALWLVANPVTGPLLRDPKNRDKVVAILHGLLDMVTKLATAFEVELEKDIEPPAPAPAEGAVTGQSPAAAPTAPRPDVTPAAQTPGGAA
jgi:hypothetical protein